MKRWSIAIVVSILGSAELFGAVPPVLLFPEDGAPVQSTTVTLSWFFADSATFDVYLGRSGSFTRVSQHITDSHANITGLVQGDEYLWYVVATDSNGNVITSDTAKFLTPARSHASTITGNGSFDLLVDGAVDGLSSSGPMYSLIDSAWHVAWQPNIEACVSNVGVTPIVNPHLDANGRGRWWDMETIVSDVTAGLTNEADRARALFEFFSRNRFWSDVANLWPGSKSEGDDPVRMLNVYGFNHCGGAMTNMVKAALAAGLRARQVNIQDHTVAEVGYGGAWHQFDTDGAAFFLDADNANVASVAQIIADPSIVYQTPIFGLDGERLLGRSQREISQVQASRYDAPWYNFEGVNHPESISRMDLTLYPDEAIHFGFSRAAIRRPKLSTSVPVPDAAFANGRLTFLPRLRTSMLWKERSSTVVNLESSVNDGRRPCIHPAEAATWGKIVVPFKIPYRIMDGVVILKSVRTCAADSLVLRMRLEGTVEVDLPLDPAIGEKVQVVRLAQYFDFSSFPVYSLDVEIGAFAASRDSAAGIDSLAISLDLLMNPRSLPQLEVGQNHVSFSQAGSGTAQVSYTWTPITEHLRPSAPSLVTPLDGEVVRGTRPQFVWAAQNSSVIDPISKCEIQVSQRADMRWPISSLFDAMVPSRLSSDTSRWFPPYAGKVNPGEPLYWRVRSMGAGGVWSLWSDVWTFSCKAPGTPLVDPSVDITADTLALTWSPAPIGERPDHYKIYGSNIRGFVAADSAVQFLVSSKAISGLEVVQGIGSGTMLFGGPHWWDFSMFPPNLVDSTFGNSFHFTSLGGARSLPKANYRIVAVDKDGTESGASGLISLGPLPWVAPVSDTIALREHRALTDSVRSVCSSGSYVWNNWNPGWWNEDDLTFSTVGAPTWVQIDPKSGVIQGIPEDVDTTITFTVRAASAVNGSTHDGAVQVMTIASNHAPVFRETPSIHAVEDQVWESQLVAVDPDQERYGDSVRYGIDAGPAWVRIDSTTGKLFGTPDAKGVLDSVLIASVSDQFGARSTVRLSAFVKHVNHAPSLQGPAVIIAREGDAFVGKIEAFDRDSVLGDHLNFVVSDGPSWLHCDPQTGMLDGRPAAHEVGSGTSTISVFDDSGTVASIHVSWSVMHVNHPPVLSAFDDLRAVEDRPVQFAISATDPDSLVFGDRVRFAIYPVASWLSLDAASGMVTGTPRIQHLADTVFTFVATDDSGATDSRRIVVPVAHMNHAPVFSPREPIVAVEDSLCSLAIHPVDRDSLLGDQVRCRLLSGPSWLSLDTLTGRAEGTPRSSDVGSGDVTIVAVDDSGAAATLVQPFTVRHTNHPPVVISVPQGWAIEDSLYLSRLVATDPDAQRFGDTLHFTPVLKPAWLNIDPHSGMISGIPRAEHLADTTLAVAITDGKGGATSVSIAFRIAHTNHTPVFASLPAKNTGAVEHAPFTMSCAATDADALSHGDTITYALRVHPSWLSIDSRTGLVSGIPPEGASDTTFTVTATDGFTVADLVVPVPVQPVNDPPQFIGRITLTILEDSSATIDLASWVRDPDNERAVLGFGIHSALEGSDCHYSAAAPESTAIVQQSEDSLVVVLDTTSAQLYVRGQKNFCGSLLPFVVSVHDPDGLVAWDTLLVSIIPVNDPPAISRVPELRAQGDTALTIDLASFISDPDDPLHALQAEARVLSAAPDTETHVTAAHPTKPDPRGSMSLTMDSLMTLHVSFSGSYQCDHLPIELRVTDPHGSVGIDTVYLSAAPAFHPPVIQAFMDTVAVAGAPFAASVRVQTPDTVLAPLTFTLHGPAWLSIDSTGRIAGIPPAPSEDSVLVIVADERGASDSLSFTIRVRAAASPEVPATYVLQQNYPNPFNPSTTIRFGLPERSRVTIDVFTILGQHVATILNTDLREGYQTVHWAPSGLASGVYFIVLDAHGLVSPARDARLILKANLVR